MKPQLAVAQLRSNDNVFLGTCFFTSSDTLLTCAHTIGPANATTSVDRELLVRWLGEDRIGVPVKFGARDSAVLKLKRPFTMKPEVAKWATFTPAEGRAVQICGFNKPDIYELEILTRYIRGYAPKYDLCILDPPVLAGFSGSPLLLDQVVVGVVVATHEDRTLAIPVTALSDLRPTSACDDTPHPEFIVDVGSITPVREWCEPAALRFTVTNSGPSQLKIPYIHLVVKDRQRLLVPHHHLPGAIVPEYLLKAHLRPGQDFYDLLDQPHVLESGETDGFRIQISSEDGWAYSLQVAVGVKTLGVENTQETLIGPFGLEFPIQDAENLLFAIRQRMKDR